jgi:hypothetical protein
MRLRLGASVRPLKFTVRRAQVVPPDALATTLRIAFGGLAGVIFALFVGSGAYFGWPALLAVTCVGAGVGAYLGCRYGDRFIVWVLRFWSRPGD